MKKIFHLLIFLLVYWVIGLLFPLSSKAQGCGDIFGPNVATNWYRENLAFIRQQANCTGPIPITVIITPAERDNHQLLLDLEKNLREFNFVPTWRPWGNGIPQGSELQAWIDTASVLSIGQFQLFNEPNNCYFGCFSGSTPNPVADAQAALAFLEASRRGDIKIPLALMPLSPRTPDSGSFLSEQNYWTQFNNACGGCVKEFDFIGLNVYPLTSPGADPNTNVDQFIQDFNSRVNFFASLGVNTATTRFVIVEAGLDPGMYLGNFEQRVRDTLAFAQALEARINSDPSILINVDQIAFFLMDENTNKQYLIYRECDDQGNCVWRVREYLAYNPNVPGPLIPGYPSLFESLACESQALSDRDSRPNDCDPCNITNNFCSSCATSFTVSDKVSWQWHEKDGDCEGNAWKITPWGGDITIDPTQTTIPFVGKKGNENEELYLADYFDGTNEYYEVANKYNQYWLDWINHTGVLRKLTPMGYQDELKKGMVERAVEASPELSEGNIHNYELKYIGRTCWDLPFLAEAFAIFVKNLGIPGVSQVLEYVTDGAHYCVFAPIDNEAARGVFALFNTFVTNNLKMPFLKIAYRYTPNETDRLASLDGNFPPDPSEENYLKKWQDWKNSEWGRLWEVVPMVSREDTPGGIYPYLGSKPRDTFTILNPDAQIEKVPHVARLYEVTQEIQNIFLPSTIGGPTSQKKTAPIIASPGEGNILGEKTLLAEAERIFHLEGHATYSAPNVNVEVCFVSDNCDGDVQLQLNGQHIAGWSPWRLADGDFCFGPGYTGSPFIVNPGDPTKCVTYTGRATRCDNVDTITCCFSVDADGNFTTNCEGGAPPAPACGLPPALPVNKCELTAIADTNPNDNLCCKEIDIKLDAVDMFDEYPYTPCEYDCPECLFSGKCPCNPECNTEETRDVNREIGINLSHPYLTPIWEQTAKNESNGIFNIFRPAEISAFEELDAHSEISYTQTGFGGLEPPVGKFYYNYLGGVQKAKEWVTTKVLMPYVEQ